MGKKAFGVEDLLGSSNHIMQGATNDLPLFEDEDPNIHQEASNVIGEWWLTERNTRLGGRTPNEVIAAGQGGRVRDIIRSVKYNIGPS